MEYVLTHNFDDTHNTGNTTCLEGSSGDSSSTLQRISEVGVLEAASLLVASSATSTQHADQGLYRGLGTSNKVLTSQRESSGDNQKAGNRLSPRSSSLDSSCGSHQH